jgi:hypothetical protein
LIGLQAPDDVDVVASNLALILLLQAPNWAALTVCELNPDHGQSDGSTVRTFAEELADAVALASRFDTRGCAVT